MPIVVIGLSHHTSPVETRERFAFAEAAVPEALGKLRASGVATEAVILSTCNRVEIYAYSDAEARATAMAVRSFLVKEGRQTVGDEIYQLAEPQSVEHLFKVACGLDSMVLGETEILGQLKKAYDVALQAGYTGPKLNKTFQRAFQVAKHIRTDTNIQRGNVSVGSVAVELAEKIFSQPGQRQVLILGAGETGEKTARAFLSRGARGIVVANRSPERAEALAKELEGRAVAFEDWPTQVESMDILISCTAAPNYILDRARLEPSLRQRRNRPLLLIDLAVPRNIDPEVNFLENVFLYNIDHLQSIANDYLSQRREEAVRCEQIIRERARALLEAFGGAPGGRNVGTSLGQEQQA